MKQKRSERGQALIVVAIAAVVLFGFSALAVDGSRSYSDAKRAQNAADASALAAALTKVRGGNLASLTAAGQQRATSDGYDGGAASDVQINNPPINGPFSCANSPTSCNSYVQVIITSYVPTSLARVIGKQQIVNVVQAVALAKYGGNQPLFDGAAMVALKQTGNNVFNVNGNFTLDVKGSGVFVNSSGNCAMNSNGNGTATVASAYLVVGSACQNGRVTINGPIQKAEQVPYPPNLGIPMPTITCSGNGSVSGNTILPGNFSNSISLNGAGTYTFMPGNYCIRGSLSINGAVHVVANDVQFKIIGGSISINGNSYVTGNNVLMHVDVNGSGISLNGNSSSTITNFTMISEKGNTHWNGNIANTFTAPTSGPYKGVLLYMPMSNDSNIEINGNSGTVLTGSIIAPASNISINGNSGTSGMNTQIIGYTIDINGNSNTSIDFNASAQFTSLKPASIELVQ